MAYKYTPWRYASFKDFVSVGMFIDNCRSV